MKQNGWCTSLKTQINVRFLLMSGSHPRMSSKTMSHRGPPPLSGHQWCIWSQCMRWSVSDPESTNDATCVLCDRILDVNPFNLWLTMSTSSFHRGYKETVTVGCESCTPGKNWKCYHQSLIWRSHLALCSSPQVPHSVQDRCGGQVDHPFLRAQLYQQR